MWAGCSGAAAAPQRRAAGGLVGSGDGAGFLSQQLQKVKERGRQFGRKPSTPHNCFGPDSPLPEKFRRPEPKLINFGSEIDFS